MPDYLKSQIRSIYLYTFFSGMMFWYGIEQLFLGEIGDAVFVRGVTFAVFSVSMLLTNIPAGAISDIWGRVRSLKLALVMMAVSLVVLSLSQNTIHYAIGAALFALFWSFDEGAKEAFVYDSLADIGQTKKYQRILGRIYGALLMGAASANFLSGFIANATSLRTTYVISLAPCAVAFFFVLRLKEPEHHKQVGKKILHQLDDAARAILHHRVLAVIVAAQMLIYTAASISGEFAQPAVVEYTGSPVVLGLAWGVMGLMMAGGNLLAHRVKHIFAFIVALLVTIAAYVLLRDSWIALIPLFVFVAGLEVVGIRGEGALQNNTTNHLRATLSSIPGSASMLLTAGLSLWVGGTASDTVSLHIFWTGFTLIGVALLLWLSIRSHIPRE